MPRFIYKAVTPAGQVVEGEVLAGTRSEVIQRLHAEGSTPIRAFEAKERTIAGLAAVRLFKRRGLSPSDIVVITQELATLLHAGVPVDRALALIGELAENGDKRNFVSRVLDGVRSGASLADALEPHRQVLPSFYIGMLRAGEAAGDLDQLLARPTEAITRAQALKESVRTAMYYPVIVLLVAAVSMVILLTAVVPEFQPIFESAGAALPLSTKVIIALGDGMQRYWWALIAGAIGLGAALGYGYRHPAGRLRWDE